MRAVLKRVSAWLVDAPQWLLELRVVRAALAVVAQMNGFDRGLLAVSAALAVGSAAGLLRSLWGFKSAEEQTEPSEKARGL